MRNIFFWRPGLTQDLADIDVKNKQGDKSQKHESFRYLEFKANKTDGTESHGSGVEQLNRLLDVQTFSDQLMMNMVYSRDKG